MIGTGYELVRAFYAEVEQNEAMQMICKPHHQSLYTWICELRNRMKREVLDLPVLYTMQMSFIGSQHTLAKAIDDLAAWGIIEVLMQAKGQGTKVKLAIAFLQKHCNYDAITDTNAIAELQLDCNSAAIEVQTIKSNKRDKTTKSPQDEIHELLSSFPSDPFQRTWQEWEQYQKEKKKKLTLTMIRQQLKLLAAYSEAEAIAMIEQSIRNGWQGLFELKINAQREQKRGYTHLILSHPNPQPIHELP
jgi:hypothetical protein